MVTRQDKEQIVSKLKAHSEGSTVAFVANFADLSMENLKSCRKALNGIAKCVVVKNTLAKIALKGGEFEAIAPFFNGPSLLVLGKNDPANAIKQFSEFRKKLGDKLVLKGGVFPGESNALDGQSLEAIGNLPPKEVILAQIAGLLTSTPASIAQSINQIIGGIGELAVKVAEKNNK